MRFQEYSSRNRAWIIFGGVLVALGLASLLNVYALWWTNLFVWIRSISRFVLPIALVCFGVYVLWGARNNTFVVLDTKGARSGSLERNINDKRLAGVCGGIAQYFGIESSLIRVVAVLFVFASPLFAFIAYGILALVLKKTSSN